MGKKKGKDKQPIEDRPKKETRSVTGGLHPTNNFSFAAPSTSAPDSLTDQSLRDSFLTFTPKNTKNTKNTPSVAEQQEDMAQRSRNPRGGARAGAHDTEVEAGLWAEGAAGIQAIMKLNKKYLEVVQAIHEMESKMAAKETAIGQRPSPEEVGDCEKLYRQSVKITEDMKASTTGDDAPLQKIQLLNALVKHNEQTAPERGSSSRDCHRNIDLDGPSDSPDPSPAENKQIRKLGGGRTSSQPPKDKDTPIKQEEEREPNIPSRTKVPFLMGAEVAFKPKISGQTEEHDWIQGIVVKIVGEGKSRRYDVQDPYPDEGKAGEIYRSSASSMVRIPPLGDLLPEYEVGKRILALYPDTTTFYRAEVKAMVDDGAKVKLLFEDDGPGVYKEVERRFVLDHKG